MARRELEAEAESLKSLELYSACSTSARAAVYHAFCERSARRGIAVVRLNLSHVLPVETYTKIPEADVYYCNLCQEDFHQGIWFHLLSECTGLQEGMRGGLRVRDVEVFRRVVFGGDAGRLRELSAFVGRVMRVMRERITNHD